MFGGNTQSLKDAFTFFFGSPRPQPEASKIQLNKNGDCPKHLGSKCKIMVETMICWYLQGNRIRPSFVGCEMDFATIHSMGSIPFFKGSLRFLRSTSWTSLPFLRSPRRAHASNLRFGFGSEGRRKSSAGPAAPRGGTKRRPEIQALWAKENRSVCTQLFSNTFLDRQVRSLFLFSPCTLPQKPATVTEKACNLAI